MRLRLHQRNQISQMRKIILPFFYPYLLFIIHKKLIVPDNYAVILVDFPRLPSANFDVKAFPCAGQPKAAEIEQTDMQKSCDQAA